MATIVVASRILAAMIAARPTAPVPMTASESPEEIFRTLRTAPTPVNTPHGKAASTGKGMSDGASTSERAGTTARVANEDCWK